MNTLRTYTWADGMGTGFTGLGYRLQTNHELVLLSNGVTVPGNNPERLWPFILTQDRRRSKAAEQSLSTQQDLGELVEHQTLGKEDILCVREKNLEELLSRVETVLTARDLQGSSPGR